MKNPVYKKFTIQYGFTGSVWQHEEMTVTAISREQAIEQVKKEISMAYGSQILKDVTIKD